MILSLTKATRAGVLTRFTPKSLSRTQLRCLTLHSYQTQDLLRASGILVPRGVVARTPLEVRDAVKSLGGICTLQAQVLWGHKDSLSFEDGLRGGSQKVQDPEQGMSMAGRMLNSRVVSDGISHQSITANQILVSEVMAHQELWHLSMTIDRENYCPAIIISKLDDNTNIEGSVIQENSRKSSTFTFGFSQGITRDLVIQVSDFLGVAGDQVTNLDGMLTKMYAIFREKDATLLEIAPLARLENGLFASLDAKLIIDDDAAKRQPDIFRLRDTSQEVEDEVKAEKHSLVYVKMNGNIGNIVNGAGLAMATNDAIGLHGGTSANFLDAGGQATKETMIQAFGIVLGDERVKAILINIYGGITRCDMIAESIIGAAQEMTLSVPLVVRLQGTNSAEGLKLLADAKLGLHVESDFGRAAQRAVELAARL